ncbi:MULTISPECIES: alanine dehydrogenase [Desulfosporosinus]|uniref:Alanine dehydrogenase n=2 Tax=Desulfosporosinus TaxID=79206 RepID=A0A1G7ZGS9_9FIRM|nr:MULTISPECIES: alanine dehydrogenase [Desulfosporosinus]AFQ43070.1 alanine dehydrogenase [Desulfosporosinus meridiei DSM 13257]KGK91708.1 alanine dehydrogenase [Desulfosporosinus sp. HMP52]SDH07991.1 alanine dehydrogenase [Desulfosporosinus hippei DSM 8344]
MLIGVPKEVKNNESRVAITPAGVHAFTLTGHKVFVEKEAGEGSGITDQQYMDAGAQIVDSAEEVWTADMIIKVKEPVQEEYGYFKKGQILFTYLHLAKEPELTKMLMEKQVVAIAYETIQLDNGSLPLLIPMSEVAGRMSIQIGAELLEKPKGGKGVLLGGVPGVTPANVTIIGGGIVGTNAARMAIGLGAGVTIVEKSTQRLRDIDEMFNGRVRTLASNPFNIANSVAKADLLVGAVLIPGARAPHLVTEDMVQAMSPGSVIVDVAIDQGGSIATIDRVTTHDDPTFIKYGVVHYAVPNIAGAVARTSTFALTNVTLGYALEIVNKGYFKAIQENRSLRKGVNVINGKLTYKAVAQSLNIMYTPLEEALL